MGNLYSVFLYYDGAHKTVGAIDRMRGADAPGRIEAAKLCYPPPLNKTIAASVHSLIFCLPFAVLNPMLGIAYIALVFAITLGHWWPGNVKKIIAARDELRRNRDAKHQA